MRRLILLLLLIAPAGSQAGSPEHALPSVPPETVGFSVKRLHRFDDAIQGEIAAGRMPGAVVAIARKGKLAYFKAYGSLDKSTGAPMTQDAIFPLASMTKPLVTVGMLALTEQNKVRINRAVSDYLPELRDWRVSLSGSLTETRSPSRAVTVQDLLRHTAGLPYGRTNGTPLERGYELLDEMTEHKPGKEFLDALARLPLDRDPGTKWQYGYGVDVAGLLIERVTGRSLGEELTASVFRPLGMKDTAFKLSAEQRGRVAQPLPLDPVTGAKQSSPGESPMECGGGCAFSTASDYLRFGQMLLNKGKFGERVLGRKTVEYMTSDHLGPEVDITNLQTDSMLNGYGFGLGVAVRRVPGVAGIMGSAGDYMWIGAYGTIFWVDPAEELVVVFMSAVHGPQRTINRQMVNTLVLQALID